MSFQAIEVNTPFGERGDETVMKLGSRSQRSDRPSEYKKYALGDGNNLSLQAKFVSNELRNIARKRTYPLI